MPLDQTDELRLNVLLTQNPTAIKINESRLLLHALTETGEATVQLHPNARPRQYLKDVREFLSSHVLGSPGGYPVFLKRWTRMGQARDKSLSKLLLLGEDEAVTAVVHAPGLSLDIARRAWWILPNADNARKMITIAEVANSELGFELSEFLLEFLAFEQEPQAMIDTVRLVLQVSPKGGDIRSNLWMKASRRTSYYVGFLQAIPHELPENSDPHPDLQTVTAALEHRRSAEALKLGLQQVMSAPGQRFLKTIKKCLDKPINQDVVICLLNSVGDYFSTLNTENRRYRDLQMWNAHACSLLEEQYILTPPELLKISVGLCPVGFSLSYGQR